MVCGELHLRHYNGLCVACNQLNFICTREILFNFVSYLGKSGKGLQSDALIIFSTFFKNGNLLWIQSLGATFCMIPTFHTFASNIGVPTLVMMFATQIMTYLVLECFYTMFQLSSFIIGHFIKKVQFQHEQHSLSLKTYKERNILNLQKEINDNSSNR